MTIRPETLLDLWKKLSVVQPVDTEDVYDVLLSLLDYLITKEDKNNVT